MVFSFRYLKKLANLKDQTTVAEVVNAFNQIGFEVESVTKFNSQISNLKFGRIIEVGKNPNSSNLNVTKVQFEDKVRTIQTTSDHVWKGMFVVAAVPGSVLANKQIATKELRGIVSEGMLTSLEELGVSKNLVRKKLRGEITAHAKVDLATDPVAYLGLDDYLVEIDILANRADANSYLVMAKELSSFFNTHTNIPPRSKLGFTSRIQVKDKIAKALVVLEAQLTSKVTVSEQILLAKSKIQAVNDAVDLANLAFIHSGQPVYVFDKSEIGSNIETQLVTSKLDKTSWDIFICSNGKPLVQVGDFSTHQNPSPQNRLVFVLGQFQGQQVRDINKRLKTTDLRAIQLGKNISAGTIDLATNYLVNKVEVFSGYKTQEAPSENWINYDFSSLTRLIGFSLRANADLAGKLLALGFEFRNNKVKIPSYRYDIFTDQDVDEEVLRVYGYDKIKEQKPNVVFTKTQEIQNLSETISKLGFSEIRTYTLTSTEKNRINPFAFPKEHVLKTFVSKERVCVRNSQAISMLDVIEKNLKNKIGDISIFSEGMVGNENKTYCLASTSKPFRDMKQCAVNLLPAGIKFVRFTPQEKSVIQNVSWRIMRHKKMVGWIGKVNPFLLGNQAFFTKVWFLEFFKFRASYEFKPYPYGFAPMKKRDITVTLKANEALEPKLQGITCFDLKVIDKFQKGQEQKVTLRITGSEEEIEVVDAKFNS